MSSPSDYASQHIANTGHSVTGTGNHPSGGLQRVKCGCIMQKQFLKSTGNWDYQKNKLMLSSSLVPLKMPLLFSEGFATLSTLLIGMPLDAEKKILLSSCLPPSICCTSMNQMLPS